MVKGESQSSEISKAAQIIKKGGVVVFPTDTVYGIGCRYDNRQALERIYKIKNRPKDQPFPVLVSSISQVEEQAQISKSAKGLIEKYWPGGLTIVLKSKTTGQKIGYRIPNSKLTISLIEAVGTPVVGTSANLHGKKPVTKFADLDPEIVRLSDFVIKGECYGAVESTVVDATQEPFKIIRQGAVKITQSTQSLN